MENEATEEQPETQVEETQAPTAENPTETTAETAAQPLSFAQRLTAAVASLTGDGAAAQVIKLTGENKSLTESVAAKEKQIGDLTAQLKTANEQLAKARASLAEAEAAVVNFERAVIDRVAQAGIPATDLPAAAATGEKREDKLRAELAETSDPKRKGEIAKELLAIRQGNN